MVASLTAGVAAIASRVRKRKAKPAPQPASPKGFSYRRAEAYEEIPNGDGIMRVDVGDYVVETLDGTLVMPPARFAEAYPDMVA